MKYLKKIVFGLALVSTVAMSTGCIGSFGLTNSVFKWNKRATGDKFGNAVIFFALNVIPVYGFCLFIDGIILNTIEFWTGDNPISMKEGQMEKQIVKSNGNSYEITATKNCFHVEQLTGEESGKYIDLVYEPAEDAWFANDGIHYSKICDGQKLKVKNYLKTESSSIELAAN